jgi:hypothetical protein
LFRKSSINGPTLSTKPISFATTNRPTKPVVAIFNFSDFG